VRRAVQRHPASEPVTPTWIPGLPKFEHHDDRHEPTLIAAARSQMTASSPRGTFSQAELAGERVITRCITQSMSAPGAAIRAMPGDLERLPAVAAAPGSGPAVLAAELLGRVRAELPWSASWGSGSRSWWRRG
jgi:hypothetical protein